MIRAIPQMYRNAFAGLPRSIWALSIVTLVYRSGTMVLPFLGLYLTNARGFTTTQAGWALSLYGLGALGGTFLGGWLSDAVGPLRVMGVSLVLSGITLWVLRFLESPWSIGATLLLLSLFAEAFRPASGSAAAAFAAPEERVRAVALRRLAINVGMTLGPAVGGFLAVIDYAWLFMVDGATCLLAALLAWRFFRGQRMPEETTSASPDGAATVRSPWSDRLFLVALLLSTLFAIAFFQVFITFPLTLRDLYGMNEDRIGIVIAVNAFTIVLLEMLLTRALQTRPPLRIVRFGALLGCVGLGLLPLGDSVGFVLVCVLVLTLGEMLYMPFHEGFVVNRAAAHNRGQYMGLYTLSWSIAFAIAPTVGTRVYENLGPATLWYGCGALGILLWMAYTALAARFETQRRHTMLKPQP